MTQQENLQSESQGSPTKLALPQGTAASAVIDVSDISGVRVFKTSSGWAISISLKSGGTVDVPYSQANIVVLERYVRVSYPEGHPDSDQGVPNLDPVDAAQAAGPETAQKDEVSVAKRQASVEHFSKLVAPLKEKLLKTTSKVKNPPKVGKKKMP